jgi:hypothetical protein
METTTIALAGTKKSHVVGYEDLTKKEQDDARTLPKNIYIQNIMSKMRVLRNATTTSPAIQAYGMQDIDIDSPPAIHREKKNIIPKHTQKNKMSPKQNFIAGKKNLSRQAEEDSEDQYNPPEKIEIGVQHSNLLLT